MRIKCNMKYEKVDFHYRYVYTYLLEVIQLIVISWVLSTISGLQPQETVDITHVYIVLLATTEYTLL